MLLDRERSFYARQRQSDLYLEIFHHCVWLWLASLRLFFFLTPLVPEKDRKRSLYFLSGIWAVGAFLWVVLGKKIPLMIAQGLAAIERLSDRIPLDFMAMMIALLTLKAFYSQSPNEVQYFLIHGFIAWQLLALIDSSCSLFTHKMTPGFGREIAADRAYRPDPRIENRIFRDFRIEQIALDEELDPGEPPEWLSSRRPRNCPFQRRAVFITAP